MRSGSIPPSCSSNSPTVLKRGLVDARDTALSSAGVQIHLRGIIARTAVKVQSSSPCVQWLGVKAASLRRQLLHLLGRLEAFAQRLVLLQPGQDIRQPLAVGPAQQAAAERREANAQDQPH